MTSDWYSRSINNKQPIRGRKLFKVYDLFEEMRYSTIKYH